MPGKEIKGTSKIASYRHGGRIGFKEGTPKLKSKIKYYVKAPENKDKKESPNGIGSGVKFKDTSWKKIR